MLMPPAAAGLLEGELLGQPVVGALWFAGVTLLAIAALWLLTRPGARAVAGFARSSRTQLDDVVIAALRATRGWVIAATGLWLGSQFLVLPASIVRRLDQAMVIVALYQAASWIALTIRNARQSYAEEHLESNAEAVTTLSAISFFGRLAVWSVFVLLALDNLGFDVTALLAGLGVGGIAVALALQSVLGDIFAALAITVDKPFVVGDFLVVGEHAGTVEQVGLKSTRLRSLLGEQIIMSNSRLLDADIRNFKRMNERRVVLELGVTYGTPAEALRTIPEIIEASVDGVDEARFDRAHFKAFGDYSLDFEAVYYVLDADYGVYMDVQQAVNLSIHRALEERGIAFAFPTQTLFVASDDEPLSLPPRARDHRSAGERAQN